jgi:hypothetical protein
LELLKIEDLYGQWAFKLAEVNMSIPEFQRQVSELEFRISQIFDPVTPLRKIYIEEYYCSFRYSSKVDKVVVDFWKGPARKGGTHSPEKTIKLPEFIYNFCNPEGAFVLERLILERT